MDLSVASGDLGGKAARPLMAHATLLGPSRFTQVVRRAFSTPSGRHVPADPGRRFHRLRSTAAAALLAVGLFTLSWERLANISVGPYNVKLPVIAFAVVAVLSAPEWMSRTVRVLRARGDRSPVRAVVILLALLIAYLLVRALFVDPMTAGVAAMASVATGAVLPALGIAGVVRSLADLAWSSGWIVAGALFAGVFGLYQLFALYTGLSQLVEYRGLGTDGVTGRIAAFSYEPAYFAYFIVMAVGALAVRQMLRGRPIGWTWLAFFGVVLTLANVRALLFLLPVVAVLLLFSWRANRRLLVRGAVVVIVLAALSIALPAVLQANSSTTAAVRSRSSSVEATATASASTSGGGSTGPSATTGSSYPDLNSHPVPVQAPDPRSVLDPNQVSSNAPRLELYRTVLTIASQNPVVGVGPGGLQRAVAPLISTTPGIAVVANNIWLQAGADGGLVALLLEGACVTVAIIALFQARRAPIQALGASWVAVLLVGGMLTSYFFDIKIWVFGALLLIGARAAQLVPDAVRSGQKPAVE